MVLLAPLSLDQADVVRAKARAALKKLRPPKAWDACARLEVLRYSPIERCSMPMEPGVKFFIMALEALGCQTFHSCEGHPLGFYISFRAPHVDLARQIARMGYLSVELEKAEDTYTLRMGDCSAKLPGGRESVLRGAATAWMTGLLAEA
jgi:hypothetical protein